MSEKNEPHQQWAPPSGAPINGPQPPTSGQAEGMPSSAMPPPNATPRMTMPAWVGAGDTGVRCRTKMIALAGAIVGLTVLAGSFLHPQYVIYSPGPAVNTLGSMPNASPMIEVQGHPTHDTQGELSFTTVSLRGSPGNEITLWELLIAAMDTRQELRPLEDAYPKWVTADQVKQENKAEMDGSQQEAVAVALRALGTKVTEKVVVKGVDTTLPAHGVLAVGDIIDAVGGKAVTDPPSVTAELQKAPAGQPVSVRFQRGSEKRTVSVTPSVSQGRKVLGVKVGSGGFTFPFTVKIHAGDVGGPSAGLMFALGVYDKLTPGAMTGGRKIAGTGTIDGTGKVGPIGGIAQKMQGAREGAGAEWFLAPADNCDKVYGHVPEGLQVVKVANFAEAVKAVTAIGKGEGAGLPQCTKPTT